MSIIDKLVERKDLEKYIDARIEKLKVSLHESMRTVEPRNRQYVKKIFKGRMLELKNIKMVIHDKKERELSEQYWEDTRGVTHDTKDGKVHFKDKVHP